MRIHPTLLLLSIHTLTACGIDAGIPIPDTVDFEESLSAYQIYQGDMGDLTPSPDYQLLELRSPLYSNYSLKQRLVHLPEGTQIQHLDNGIPEFPEGTILVKTFYYPVDERDSALGHQVVETRLEILSEGEWNVGTYVWNVDQSDAELVLKGKDTTVSWIDTTGNERTIDYHYPSEKECVACHQQNEAVAPIGPSMRNLNIEILDNSQSLNQLDHLQTLEYIASVDATDVSSIPDYKDESLPLEDRARAYLDMNCAHCHNPDGWKEASNRDFDFRFEISLQDSHIAEKKDKIKRVLENGEMPYLGVTVLHEEGVALIVEYLDSL